MPYKSIEQAKKRLLKIDELVKESLPCWYYPLPTDQDQVAQGLYAEVEEAYSRFPELKHQSFVDIRLHQLATQTKKAQGR
jgi:hypothetical protein